MGLRQNAFEAAKRYLRTHPQEVSRTLRNALGLRFGVPMAALQWLGAQAEAGGKVRRLQLLARPPGIAMSADVELMKTPVRGGAVIYVDRVALSEEELAITLRLEDVTLELTADADTPVAALIKSGALDLSNPGTLAGYLPGRSPVLVEAEGNRLILDLMREPRIARDERVRRLVGLLTSFMSVHGVETDPEHLDVVLRAFPRGLSEAARAVDRHLVRPSLARVFPRFF